MMGAAMPDREDKPFGRKFLSILPLALLVQVFYVLRDAIKARLRRSGGKGKG